MCQNFTRWNIWKHNPHKYWKSFLLVKLRAKANFKTQNLWSTKDCDSQQTVCDKLFALIISLFFMWTFKEILWKCLAELFINLQGESRSHKTGTPGKGQETHAKGPNQAIAKSRVQAQLRRKVSEMSRNIETQEKGDRTRWEAQEKDVP